MIIPSSTVNVMSNKEDYCFQCQELRHIAQHCPHIRCYECDEYGHIKNGLPTQNTSFQNTNDTSQGTQRSPCQIKLGGTTGEIKKNEAGPDHSSTTEDTAASVITICTQAALDHNSGVDPPTDCYSFSDHSSNLGEESDSLN